MKYIDEFRNREIAIGLSKRIATLVESHDKITIMEVCGTHTMSVYRYGLKKLLPPNIRLLSGPGCPVCVTPVSYIDTAIAISKDVLITTFGDMMRVPGSSSSLEKERAKGTPIVVVYSTLDALSLAEKYPEKQVVFLAVGFETTAPTVAASIIEADRRGLKNYFVLTSHKVMPPAMKALLEDKDLNLDGFICPAHVSTIIGSRPYEFIAKDFHVPCVIAGFEPLDILQGIYILLEQIVKKEATVKIQYSRVAKQEGNPTALALLDRVFEPCDAEWRGLGLIHESGLKLREFYAGFDALALPLPNPPEVERKRGQSKGCICGDILRGVKTPLENVSFLKRFVVQSILWGRAWSPARVHVLPFINTVNKANKITLAHGSGGKLTHELIRHLFLPNFNNDALSLLGDSALLQLNGMRLAFTTDSYVVKPIFFPGGDIGRLAVCGTINDLAVVGARPMFLSAGFIIEEGFEMPLLEKVVNSMKETAASTGVNIVTGDTKVVEYGSADGLYINTCGIGIVDDGINLSTSLIEIGDKIIISGTIGDHGLAVLSEREGLGFSPSVKSDCAPLSGMIGRIIASGANIRFMRDPTRGGLATTLNEIADGQKHGILIEEQNVPINDGVRALCEILGYDPLYIANEGKVVIVTSANDAVKVRDALREDDLGKNAEIIGEVISEPQGKVCLKTVIGGTRIVDMLVGDQLPRIC